ncbi:MAG: hypothetical protein ACLFSQ_08385 [Candidatus Zixiibacteriota bacterium]
MKTRCIHYSILIFIAFLIISANLLFAQRIADLSKIEIRGFSENDGDIQIGEYKLDTDEYKNYRLDGSQIENFEYIRIFVYGLFDAKAHGNYITVSFKGEKRYTLKSQHGSRNIFYFTESVKYLEDRTESSLEDLEIKVSLYKYGDKPEVIIEKGYFPLFSDSFHEEAPEFYRSNSYSGKDKDIRGKIEFAPEVLGLGEIENRSGNRILVWRIYNNSRRDRDILGIRPTCTCTRILWPLPPILLEGESYTEIVAIFDPSPYKNKRVSMKVFIELDYSQRRKCGFNVFVKSSD